MTLDGDAAFSALKRTVQGTEQPPWEAPANPAFERLRRAWLAPERRTQIELAVLLRQALMYEASRRLGGLASITLGVGSPLQGFVDWDNLGLRADKLDGGWLVSPQAWMPPWATSRQGEGPDALAASERPRPAIEAFMPAGDPFLETLAHTRYHSVGQRAAARSALTTPAGGTLAISLATGEGKSLIFQLIAKVGFATSASPSEDGLTLVVTPTVALAIDHENAALEKGFEGPMAYRSGNAENNDALIQRIREDRQQLCFASPEAICGPLRSTLTQAATRGRLRALVVDEAHLVDGWGTGFRTEFQTLAGIRHQWVTEAPPRLAARTILLSATLPPSALEVLRTLYAGPGEFRSISALRLRGEPDYWAVRCSSEVERQTRVLEAIRHVPRPAILYVTRVDDAKTWSQHLKQSGFDHIETVHGETPGSEREHILRAWRGGDVDLVVATSAFGLGIDYGHVRSVVHACIPESLDRFYQEVGRGGRDARSCLALTLYTPGDLQVAERISQTLVISLRRGLQRWRSMFDHGRPAGGEDRFVVPLDVAPSHEPDDIDMRGERNSDWNARVLTLMARGGLIRMLGAPLLRAENEGPCETVEVLDLEHRLESTWIRRVEPVRQTLAAASRGNLDLMLRFISKQECPSPLLLDLYGVGPEAHACGRCAACRAEPSLRRPERPRSEPLPPWPAPQPLGPIMEDMLRQTGRLIVWYDPKQFDRTFRRRFADVVRALPGEGIANVVLVGTPLLTEAWKAARDRPMFVSEVERLTQRRLPGGAEFVVIGAGSTLEILDLSARQPGHEQVLMLPAEIDDPSRPGVQLTKTYAGRHQMFDAFYKRLCG
jgi:superfamily II DNA helicase RecQ